jgi:hypothetical protein
MKKIITTFLFSSLTMLCVAQNDTLLYEPFDVDPVTNPNISFQNQIQPPAQVNDPSWYNWDQDALPDMSTQGNRPGEWFWQSGGFADVDTLDGCMASNSWTLAPTTPVENYLVTPAIQIIDANASVHWKSATFQTPRYLDGYKVLVSTTNNDLNSFTTEVFRAAEMTGWINEPNDPPDSTFASYMFGPSGAWIQGLSGTDVEYAGDSMRLRGIQTDQMASLALFSGQTIYIAFVHYTFDDNLLSLDDILVKGTNPIGFNEITRDPMKMFAYPNPAMKQTVLNFTLDKKSDVTVKVTDFLGNVILTKSITDVSGKYSFPVNVENFSAGTYFYTVIAETATSTGRFSVVK